MIRRPPRSTPLYSSAASDVYKRQLLSRRGLYHHVLLPSLQDHQVQKQGRRLFLADDSGLTGSPGRYTGSCCEAIQYFPAFLPCDKHCSYTNFICRSGPSFSSHPVLFGDTRGILSVSYTHLRAHETDSYL